MSSASGLPPQLKFSEQCNWPNQTTPNDRRFLQKTGPCVHPPHDIVWHGIALETKANFARKIF